MGVLARGDTGTFGSGNVGLNGTFALTLDLLRIELSGTYWLPQTIDLSAAPPNPPRGGKLKLTTVGLVGCYAFLHTERIDVSPCAGMELGLFEGSAYGVSEPGSGAATWTALRVGALGTWRVLGPFALRLEVEGLVPASRPTFLIGGVTGIVHRPAPLSGRAGAGLEIHF
jgi:hypothetical protein